jgi:hypothetical protein
LPIPRDFFNVRILCNEDYDFAEDVDLKAVDLGWSLTSSAEPLQENFYFLQAMHSDDKVFWECIKEMLSESFKLSEMSLKGSYEINLIFIHSLEIKAFDISNFAKLVSNHANRLSFGQAVCFPYASMWFYCKKLSPLDWGKVKFSHRLHFFSDDRSKLDLVLKKMSKQALHDEKFSWIIFDDLSRSPIFRFGEDPQTERLFKWVRSLCEKSLPERMQIHLCSDKREAIDLLKQFEVSTTEGQAEEN